MYKPSQKTENVRSDKIQFVSSATFTHSVGVTCVRARQRWMRCHTSLTAASSRVAGIGLASARPKGATDRTAQATSLGANDDGLMIIATEKGKGILLARVAASASERTGAAANARQRNQTNRSGNESTAAATSEP